MKKVVTLLIVLAMLIGTVGCSSTSTDIGEGTDIANAEETATSKTTEKTGSKDMVVALSAEPLTLDAHYITDITSGQVQWQIHETLFMRNEKSEVVPLLADSAVESEDGLSWVIKLKEGINFSCGAPFNADAVKKVFDRLLADETASPKRSALDGVQSIEAISDYEVKFNLAKRDMIFCAKLTNYTTSIMCPDSLDKGGLDNYSQYACGTGPLKLEAWNHGTDMVLVQNDGYHGEKPTVDKVNVKFITEEATRIMMMESGEVDIVSSISPLQCAEMEANPNIDIIAQPGYRVIYVGMNNQKKPFDNKLVRQAINYAIDKESLVKNLLNGMAEFPPSGMWPYTVQYSVQGLNPYSYDPEKSKTLLTEAGYPNGFDCKFYCYLGARPADSQIIPAIQAMLAQVGINAEIVQMDRAAFMQVVDALNDDNERDLFFLSKGCSTGDPEFDMTLYINADGGQNYCRYNNPEIEAMVRDLPNSADLDDRAARLAKIQELFNEDCGYCPLYYEYMIFAKGANVEGFQLLPNELFRLAWLTK